jgi:hypothetical protein
MNRRFFFFVLSLMTLIGITAPFQPPAEAVTIEGTLDLATTHFDPGAFGLSAAPALQAHFRVAFVGGGSPDPTDLDAVLQDFDLTIGNAHWDETMPYTGMRVLAQGDTLLGFQVLITDTKPEHPDLSFLLPTSPGLWEAHDIINQTDNGKIGGVYSINAAPVPEPATFALLAAGLAGIALRNRKHKKKRHGVY